jgi:hypothetical protein
MPAEWVSVQETTAPPAGVERTVLYGQQGSPPDPIAVVVVNDLHRPEAVLGWPVGEPRPPGQSTAPFKGLDAARASKLIDSWLTQFLPAYGFHPWLRPVEVKYSVAGDPDTRQIQPPVRVDKIVAEVNGVKIRRTDTLEILALKADTLVFEVTYDATEAAVQCACLLREARLPAVVSLFRTYHRNNDVRSESEISLRAFATPASFKMSLNALAPLPVVP